MQSPPISFICTPPVWTTTKGEYFHNISCLGFSLHSCAETSHNSTRPRPSAIRTFARNMRRKWSTGSICRHLSIGGVTTLTEPLKRSLRLRFLRRYLHVSKCYRSVFSNSPRSSFQSSHHQKRTKLRHSSSLRRRRSRHRSCSSMRSHLDTRRTRFCSKASILTSAWILEWQWSDRTVLESLLCKHLSSLVVLLLTWLQ
jgi:hypothetical protein